MQSRKINIALNLFQLCFSAVLLCLPAFWNGFPLIFSDTVAHITSGIDLISPIDRPIFYGLFLISTNFYKFFWSSIFIQALLISYLYLKLGTVLFPTLNKWTIYSALILTAIFTNLPWFVDQLIPDIFSSILFLALIIFAVGRQILSKNEKMGLLGLVCICICMHSSNLPIAFLLIFFISLIMLFQEVQFSEIKIYFLTTILASMIAIALLISSNIWSHHGFTIAKTSKVFLLARMLEDETALDYLNKNCIQENYKTCLSLPILNEAKSIQDRANVNVKPEIKNLISSSFLWGGGVKAAGGILEVNKEASEIILKSFLANPSRQLLLSLKNMSDQIITFKIGEQMGSYASNAGFDKLINASFPESYSSYINSEQYKGILEKIFPILNLYYTYMIYLSSILWIYLIIRIRKTKESGNLVLLILTTIIFLAVNALVTGGMSGVFDRYQSRIIWLVPGLAFLIFSGIVDSSKKSRINL